MKVRFYYSFAHFRRNLRPTHGPQAWPWWRLISAKIMRLPDVRRPSTAWRLWLYTRFGAAHFDVTLDRRPLNRKKTA